MGHGARGGWKKLKNSIAAGGRRKYNSKRNSGRFSTADEECSDGISNIVITIKDYLDGVSTLHKSDKSWSIYRVPRNMRGVYENAYDPKLVSIGPFHHHDIHLKGMEDHKVRFLLRLLQPQNSTTESLAELGQQCEPSHQRNQDVSSIEALAKAMTELEKKARDCYSETFDIIDSNKFVLMMILDGCFIVELLRFYAKCDKENVDDPIFTTRWMLPILQRDLLMIENQLPLFVLQKLFDMTSSGNEASLNELTLKFFDPLMPREKKLLDEKCKFDGKHDHLLGLFRFSFLSSFKDKKPQIESKQSHSPVIVPPLQERQLINCVTELQEAGVEFKKREDHDLLDIEFKHGVLEIPPLLIDDHTGPIFLNFVALEQCDRYAEPYFTHYVLFFDSLVNSSKDVELLHYNGIINHVLGSDEEVADLLNKLCKEVVYDVDDFYLSKQLKDVNRYYGTSWHKWRAKWKRDYFSSPWAFFSLLAAIFLLFLTTVQTFFSIFSYVLPPS